MKAKFTSEGATVLGGSQERLAKQLADDVAKWARVAKAAGIKAE